MLFGQFKNDSMIFRLILFCIFVFFMFFQALVMVQIEIIKDFIYFEMVEDFFFGFVRMVLCDFFIEYCQKVDIVIKILLQEVFFVDNVF